MIMVTIRMMIMMMMVMMMMLLMIVMMIMMMLMMILFLPAAASRVHTTAQEPAGGRSLSRSQSFPVGDRHHSPKGNNSRGNATVPSSSASSGTRGEGLRLPQGVPL